MDLINRLEDEYESIQLIVTQEKKVIKELEEEVGKEQKEKHNKVCGTFRTRPVWKHVLRSPKLLESLTDALPSDRRGAQMDDDDGSATE